MCGLTKLVQSVPLSQKWFWDWFIQTPCSQSSDDRDDLTCLHYTFVVMHISDHAAASLLQSYEVEGILKHWLEGLREADIMVKLLAILECNMFQRFNDCGLHSKQCQSLLAAKAQRWSNKNNRTVVLRHSCGYLEGPESPSLYPEVIGYD